MSAAELAELKQRTTTVVVFQLPTTQRLALLPVAVTWTPTLETVWPVSVAE